MVQGRPRLPGPFRLFADACAWGPRPAPARAADGVMAWRANHWRSSHGHYHARTPAADVAVRGSAPLPAARPPHDVAHWPGAARVRHHIANIHLSWLDAFDGCGRGKLFVPRCRG